MLNRGGLAFGFCGIDVGVIGTGGLFNKGGLVFGFCGTVVGFLFFGLGLSNLTFLPI